MRIVLCQDNDNNEKKDGRKRREGKGASEERV